jgi:hypothetical protein
MNSFRKHIANIERNHAIIDAQVERLAALSPDPAITNLGPEGGNIANISTLLDSTIYGQMQGATAALRTLAEVQAGFAGKTVESTNLHAGQRESVTIDAEFHEVKEGK